ncbi:hypothetical protein O7626_07920 [Micromonospora sp. WMMD1102]|uniref:hypothetical protein n=1 Tax=Micromonospora sp. WMMD1102 TaxID=3016105 RepID=UPI002414E67A|nr:hypothetical protein [Micromonospora sp. WMMD1102]MDG4785854.1 hypothetical protein [Micromonospora sp. WMMD1102]
MVDSSSDAEASSTEVGRSRQWRILRPPVRIDILAIGAYVLLGVFICANYWVDVNHRVSSHLPTDHSWFEWLFAHGAYSVRHLENPLFSARQNAPDGVNMMANTSLLGVTLPLAPLTWAFGPQVTYALYLGGALAATAATSYWALSRHLVRSRGAAFVGGAFLGFAPGIVHHANGQPNFVSNFLLPLIVVRVFRLGEPGRWPRNGLVLGLLVAYQIFVNEEMLLLTALACAVAVPLYVAFRWSLMRSRIWTFLRGLGVGGALALLLAGYPIWYQFNGPQSYRGLQGGVFHNWGEDLRAFVTYSRDTIAGSPEVEKTIGVTEQNTWLGWPLVGLVVLVAVLLWRGSVAARIAALLGAGFALASLGRQIRYDGQLTEHEGPWRLLPEDLPLVEMMMPTRLSLVTVATVGILVALAWNEVARTRPRPANADTTAPAGSNGITSNGTASNGTASTDAADTVAIGKTGTTDPTGTTAAGQAAPTPASANGTAPGRPDSAGPVARRLRILAYAAIVLALLPIVPRPLPAMHVDPPPTFITSGAWRPYVPAGRTLVPVPIPSNVHGLSTLRWSALTQQTFPIPAGYFIGPDADGFGVFGAPSRPTSLLIYGTMDRGAAPLVTEENRRQAIEDLRFWKASVVVLGDHPAAPALHVLLAGLLGPGQRVDDVWLWDVRPLVD